MSGFRLKRYGYALLFALAIWSGAAAAAKIEHQKLGDELDGIVISGEILPGDDDQFRKLSLRFKYAIVLLDSPGGALLPGLEIGKMIRLAGYATYVYEDAVCASSCALIWLAGERRLLSAKGHVGFHASYRDNRGRKQETGVGNAIIGHYLSLLNLSQRAVIFATSASPHEISWLSEANRQEAGIPFETFDPQPPSDVDRTADQQASNDRTQAAVPPAVEARPVGGAPAEPQAASPTEMTVEMAIASFRAMIRAPGYARSMFEETGLSESSYPIFREHFDAIYGDERLTQYLGRQLHASRHLLADPGVAREAMAVLSEASMSKLVFAGMARLGNADVKAFIHYLAAVPVQLTPAECRAVYIDKDVTSFLEFVALARLGNPHLARYLALSRQAVFAELSDFPAPFTLERHQVELAKKAFNDQLLENLEKLPPDQGKRIAKAIVERDADSDRDACGGYQMILKTVDEMTGLPGDWARRNFMTDGAR